MENLIIGIIFSFILTMVFLPILIKFASANKLFVPQSYRRMHHSSVSALGGLAIFVSSTLSFILFSDLVNFPDYRMIISSAFLMFALGLRDDLFEMTPFYKLFGQIVAVALVVLFANVRIDFLQHYFDGNFGVILDIFASIIIVVGIINAYNMIDGIDMLAAMTGFIILSTLGVWFFIVQQFDYSLALLSLSSALLAFMVYNHSPAKIFMGDTGTMTIALIMSVSLVQFDNVNSLINGYWKFNNAPAIAFSLISLLVFDMTRVAIYRIYRHKSPVKGDRTHIHHILSKIGWSSTKISFFIGITIVFQVFTTVLLDKYLNSVFLLSYNIAVLLLFYAFILGYLLPKQINSDNNIS